MFLTSSCDLQIGTIYSFGSLILVLDSHVTPLICDSSVTTSLTPVFLKRVWAGGNGWCEDFPFAKYPTTLRLKGKRGYLTARFVYLGKTASPSSFLAALDYVVMNHYEQEEEMREGSRSRASSPLCRWRELTGAERSFGGFIARIIDLGSARPRNCDSTGNYKSRRKLNRATDGTRFSFKIAFRTQHPGD